MIRNARRVAAEVMRDRPPQGAPACWIEPAVVASVTAGAASDGNALVTVTWRGGTTPAAYPADYTPVIGHTVQVIVQPPGGLIILNRIIGTP